MDIIEDLLKGVKELTDVELTAEDLAVARHNLITVLLIFAEAKKGNLSKKDVAQISLIFDSVRKLKMQARSGERNAQTLFDGIAKLSNPPKKNISDEKKKTSFLPAVEKMLKGGTTSNDLIHGYEFRRLMSELSFIVESVCICPKVIKDSYVAIEDVESFKSKFPHFQNEIEALQSELKTGDKIYELHRIKAEKLFVCRCSELTPKSKVKLREKQYPVEGIDIETGKEFKEVRKISFNEKFYREVENVIKIASSHNNSSIEKGAALTWLSLAKKIYLERLSAKDEKAKYTESSLNRSLRSLTKFEKENPEEVKRSFKLPVFKGRKARKFHVWNKDKKRIEEKQETESFEYLLYQSL